MQHHNQRPCRRTAWCNTPFAGVELLKLLTDDNKQLSARAAAGIAPVASNANEAGRAKTRRVERVGR